MKPPFPKEHIYACILEQLNTRGENRTNDMYTAINEALHVIIRSVPKNVGVFCASYVVLDGLLKAGIEQMVNNSGKAFFCENPALTSSENDILIEQYKNKSKTTGAVLLGVCGGRNSEGEDFPGDFMNAVAIVGIPYQRPTPSLEAKIKYYETLFPTKGRQLSYIIPAFQRSNQACGRPIRRPEDWAMIFLLDYRFAQNQSLISNWIVDSLHFLTNDTEVIKREIQQFYAKRNNVQK
jgi:DNA excision repair protein ERCC-2